MTNILQSRAEQHEQLWRTLMPAIASPGFDQFMLWAALHRDELVQRGFSRAAIKVRKLGELGVHMAPEIVARYASGVMNNETRGLRRHGVGTAGRCR